ncbi:MAG: nucleotidyltransferase domain-containing protein [Legionella sp.]|jgi:predicted nucleotidyltransferase
MDQQYGLPSHAVDKINEVFRLYPQIKQVILYGSRALGSYKPSSDIDLCIDAESMSLSQLLKIENQLDDLLLPWNIDLCLKHVIDNPDLLAHIDHAGTVFYLGAPPQ